MLWAQWVLLIGSIVNATFQLMRPYKGRTETEKTIIRFSVLVGTAVGTSLLVCSGSFSHIFGWPS